MTEKSAHKRAQVPLSNGRIIRCTRPSRATRTSRTTLTSEAAREARNPAADVKPDNTVHARSRSRPNRRALHPRRCQLDPAVTPGIAPASAICFPAPASGPKSISIIGRTEHRGVSRRDWYIALVNFDLATTLTTNFAGFGYGSRHRLPSPGRSKARISTSPRPSASLRPGKQDPSVASAPRDEFDNSSSRFRSLFEHDLFGKTAVHFPDHAPAITHPLRILPSR